MMNKILVFWGLAVTAILLFQNLITWNSAAILWSNSSKSYILVGICTFIWMAIWYGMKWMFEQKPLDEDEVDF